MGFIKMPHDQLIWKGVKEIPKIFTEEEISKIFKQLLSSKDYWKKGLNKEWGAWLHMRDVCLVATIYVLGLRPKEACGIKFTDFDLKKMYLKISGANNKTKRDRLIPVPKVLMQFYKPYLEFPKARFWKGSDYLFPSMQNQMISSERLKYIFREKVLKPAGLWRMPTKSKVPSARLYTLRHTRATEIMKKQMKETGKADIYSIANILGHTDLRSTLIYLHTDDEYRDYLRHQLEI